MPGGKRKVAPPKVHRTKNKAEPVVADKKARSRASRAAIMPSQRVDHCTPPVVADGIIYPVLGKPFDLDPCSNKKSILLARRSVMLPDDGKAISWRNLKVFVNFPFGEENEEWIKKIVTESRHHGAEVIGLFPANVSAKWFDLVVATARACFFWGPGDGGRRVTFMDNDNAATFTCCIAYWGPNLNTFVQHAIRYCHPWFPEYDLRLVRAILAEREQTTPTLGLAVAEELLAQSRHDDLAAALVALGDAPLRDVLAWGRSSISNRLLSLSTYELASALVCAPRTSAQWLERRLPRTPAPSAPNQLGLRMPEPGRQPDEAVEDAVYRHIRAAGREGLPAGEIEQRLSLGTAEVRNAIRQLRESARVTKTGTTRKPAYAAIGEEPS